MHSFVIPALIVVHHLSEVAEINGFPTDRAVFIVLDFVSIGVIEVVAPVRGQRFKSVPHGASPVFQ